MSNTAGPLNTIADRNLRSAVEAELDWDPAVPATSIGVAVTDHAVTLAGTVRSLPQRLAAVKAARRVKGVHAIVDEILVIPVTDRGTSDQNIGLAVEQILESSASVPSGITATVRQGFVHVVAEGHDVWLSGHTRSLVARAQAEAAAWSSPGVETVYNDIRIANPQLDDDWMTEQT